MIETEFKTISVVTGRNIIDNEICLRIEDNDSFTGILNLCWLNEQETGRLITYLQEAKRKLEKKRLRLDELIAKTNFSALYNEFEKLYNRYPVQMSDCEAFGHALHDGLIDDDVYFAAQKYYGRMWNYVGD